MWDRVVDWFYAVVLNRCRNCEGLKDTNALLSNRVKFLSSTVDELSSTVDELSLSEREALNRAAGLSAQLEVSRREITRQNTQWAASDNEAVGLLSVAQAKEIEVMRVLDTLKFYAEPKNYWDGEDSGEFGIPVRFPSMAQTDGGEKARKALEDFKR